jgi:hypothetical protein
VCGGWRLTWYTKRKGKKRMQITSVLSSSFTNHTTLVCARVRLVVVVVVVVL